MWSQCSPLPPVLLLRESNWAIAALRNFQKPSKSAKNVLAVRLKNNLQALRDVSWVRLGSGLSLSMFRAYIQIFHNIQTNAFFLRWFAFVVLTAVMCVNEVVVTFSSAHCISKHSCVLLFSARISLKTRFRRRGIALKSSITSRFLVCFTKRWPANRRFMPIALS